MNRRTLLKSALLAIAATASGLRVAEAGIALVEPEEIPLMCLQIGDQKIWLYDGDNKFDKGFASGTARVTGSSQITLHHLDVFTETEPQVKIEMYADAPLNMQGPISIHSRPIRFDDGGVEFAQSTKYIEHDGFSEVIETERIGL